MTGRHTRHIVLAVLAIGVLSVPVYAQLATPQEIADLREEIERIDNELSDRVVTEDLDEAVATAKTEAIEAVVTALNRL